MINEADIPEGATPLDPDESAGLIPGLTTRSELNSFEQANIAQAANHFLGVAKILTMKVKPEKII